MKANWMSVTVALAAAVVLTGCPEKPEPQLPDAGMITPPGGGGGGGGGGGDASAARAYCNDMAGLLCDRLITCGIVASTGKAQCLSLVTVDLCRGADAVAVGAYTFDAQKAQTCRASVTAPGTSCDDIFDSGDPACDEIYAPAAARGERCVASDNCTLETDVCVGPPCGTVCLASGALNQPCYFGQCDEGLFCDSATQTCRAPRPLGAACEDDGYFSEECDEAGRCNGTTCVALPGSGQACVTNFQRRCAPEHYCDGTDVCRPVVALGQPCNAFDACGEAGTCKFTGTQQTCVAREPAGGACSWEGDCQSGLACRNGVCTARSQEGQGCTSYSDCASGLSCDDVLRTCEKYASVPIGGVCTDHTKYCSGSAYCANLMEGTDGGMGTAGTCAQRTVGSPCEQHSDCPSPGFCDVAAGPETGTCQTSKDGSPCSSSWQCPSTHYCGPTDTCVSRKQPGSACSTASECVSPNECLSTTAGDGGMGMCGPRGGSGAACGDTDDCLFPFACVNGQCTQATGLGQPCYYEICVDAACDLPDGGTGPGTCVATRPEGSTCRSHSDCTSRACDDGICVAACL